MVARMGIQCLNMLSGSTIDGCGRYFVYGNVGRRFALSAYRVLFFDGCRKLSCVGACWELEVVVVAVFGERCYVLSRGLGLICVGSLMHGQDLGRGAG
jgi:hypothetical protein